MRRAVWVTGLLSVVLACFIGVWSAVVPVHHVRGEAEDEHEPMVYNPRIGAACGIERWGVKTGTDASARSVNMRSVYQTSIASLTGLHAPGVLPPTSRIRPTETRLYAVSATLIRFKEEQDSDFHLVLSDGSHTMIAEIPSPDCVGSQSPFRASISNARSTFSARYQVTNRMHYVRTKIMVVGVGFFDFLHGQSGVAPNGIELHPVLSIQFAGGKPPLPAPAPPKRTGGHRPAGSFVVRAWVSPSTMPYDAHPTLYAQSVPGATCSASVVYSTGRSPVSFDGSPQTVGSSGSVSWSWHEETSGSGGTATVTCSYRGQTTQATARFSVTH